MSAFTLRQFEIFAQVVEHGSFRRCADHLGVSPVSIGEHIRELETRLGAKLFDRNAGGPVSLTRKGERAYRRISAILTDVSDLSRDVDPGQEEHRRIRLAMYAYVMRYLRNVLREFRARRPEAEVTVDLELTPPRLLHERVQRRELDIAYFISFDARDAPPSELLRLDPLGIFVARNHPLTRRDVVRPQDLRSTPVVHLAPKNPLRMAVDQALEQAGCSGSPVALEADEYGLILTSTARGEGFVCMFQALADDVAQAANLVPLRLAHPIPALQVRQITRHSARHNAVLHELTETLSKALKTL